MEVFFIFCESKKMKSSNFFRTRERISFLCAASFCSVPLWWCLGHGGRFAFFHELLRSYPQDLGLRREGVNGS